MASVSNLPLGTLEQLASAISLGDPLGFSFFCSLSPSPVPLSRSRVPVCSRLVSSVVNYVKQHGEHSRRLAALNLLRLARQLREHHRYQGDNPEPRPTYSEIPQDYYDYLYLGWLGA